MDYYFYKKIVNNKGILQIKKLLENKAISSEELVWAYLERIAYIDNSGQCLNSVREINPDVFSIAKERDIERKLNKIRGPLHGIPILLKDCIDTADRMHTTCGSIALKNHYAKNDAFIVKKLRSSGAIILGKNNMSEFYGFISKKAESGYSSILGKCIKNPFGPGLLKPGGSSGGSAVSIAADLATASIGTETSGSILEPAVLNGVVGFKPSIGLVSRSGILPVMSSQDVPGVFTKTTEDVDILLDCIIGRDENDPDTIKVNLLNKGDLECCDDEKIFKKSDSLINPKKIRLGFVKSGYCNSLSEKEIEYFDETLKLIKNAGIEIVEIVDYPPAEVVGAEYGKDSRYYYDHEEMYHAFKARFDHYISQIDDLPFKNLEGIIEWNDEHPEALKFGQDYFYDIADRKALFMTKEFIKAKINNDMVYGEKGAYKWFKLLNIDGIILPGPRAGRAGSTIGLPVLTMPTGFVTDKGPLGISILGRDLDDYKLVGIGNLIEKLLPPRPIPNL